MNIKVTEVVLKPEDVVREPEHKWAEDLVREGRLKPVTEDEVYLANERRKLLDSMGISMRAEELGKQMADLTSRIRISLKQESGKA